MIFQLKRVLEPAIISLLGDNQLRKGTATMRIESHDADENVYALSDRSSGARFVSSWQLNSKREYPKKEVDSCGCGCSAKS
jgi:hypothetical protein